MSHIVYLAYILLTPLFSFSTPRKTFSGLHLLLLDCSDTSCCCHCILFVFGDIDAIDKAT